MYLFVYVISIYTNKYIKKGQANMLKRFMAGLLAVVLLTAPIYADTENKYTAESNIQAYADTLEDGNYYVPVQLWHAYANQESMGNVALKETRTNTRPWLLS